MTLEEGSEAWDSIYGPDRHKMCFCYLQANNCAYCDTHRGDFKKMAEYDEERVRPHYLGMEGRFAKYNYGDKWDLGYEINQYSLELVRTLV